MTLARLSRDRSITGMSRKFDEQQPTPTIYWRGRLAGNSVLRSEIAC